MIQTIDYPAFVASRWSMMDELMEGGHAGRLSATLHAALMLASEAGEVAGLVQKGYQAAPIPADGETRGPRDILAGIDREKLLNELGDVRFALELMLLATGVNMYEIENRNVDKLSERYPAGFDPARSIHRELAYG
jgi:NTP pyrophosphatase (non-canonical NTP hydrolase)